MSSWYSDRVPRRASTISTINPPTATKSPTLKPNDMFAGSTRHDPTTEGSVGASNIHPEGSDKAGSKLALDSTKVLGSAMEVPTYYIYLTERPWEPDMGRSVDRWIAFRRELHSHGTGCDQGSRGARPSREYSMSPPNATHPLIMQYPEIRKFHNSIFHNSI